MKPEESEVEPLLNAKDVSKILRCSLPLVYKMASRGQLLCIRWDCPGNGELLCIRWDCPGNGEKRPRTVVRFKIEDVLQFMENHYGN
jgi:hypothetical protein